MRLFYPLFIKLLIINVLQPFFGFSQCAINVNSTTVNYSSIGGGCTTTPSSVTINSLGNNETFIFDVSITISGDMLMDFVSANSSIIINPGVTVTVNGNLTMNGNSGIKDFIVDGSLTVLQNFVAQNNITYSGGGIIRVDGTWSGNGNASDCPDPCNLVFDVPNCQPATPICTDVTNNPFLPINLISFKTRGFNRDYIDFEWQTASELNNAYFNLEGSSDNKNFSIFAQIEGKGSNNVKQTYYYRWLIANPEWRYFRLKQVDLDGKENIFSTIFIPNPFEKIKVNPHLFNNRQYQVEIPARLNGEWILFSLNGEKIKTQKFTSEKKDKIFTLDLSADSFQLYLLKIQHQNGVEVFKLF